MQSVKSSRSSTVGIPSHSFSSSPLTCRVPQCSVLGPVLFILYITPLSSLISASSIFHLLYRYDTQLFISFVPENFLSAISNLQSTITLITSLMSSNYLTLNPSQTEFLLISLPQQTSKIVNPSLCLPATKPIMLSLFAKNLGFIFNLDTVFLETDFISLQSLSLPYSRSSLHPTLDSITATTVATAQVHSRLDYCNSLYHNLPITQI